MMEKYGVQQDTYEVVVPVKGESDKFQKIASNVSLPEANKIKDLNSGSFIRPE